MFGRNVGAGGQSAHRHPHDPSDIIEWVATLFAIAFVITVVVALAFQIGK